MIVVKYTCNASGILPSFNAGYTNYTTNEINNVDGTYTSLFSLDYIDFSNDNVIRIPPRRDCSVKLQATQDISKASITIYVYYKAV